MQIAESLNEYYDAFEFAIDNNPFLYIWVQQ